MGGSDRTVLIVVPLIALAIGFYLLAISPKQSELSDLSDEIDSLNGSISAAESQIGAAEQARDNFSDNYGELVTLGRAAPEDDDQSTLIFDLAEIGKANDVEFRQFEVIEGAISGAAPPPPAPTAPTPSEAAAASEERTASAEAVATGAAPATELAASTLPLGATVGAGGLPVVPYEFRFLGNFFDMASFFGDLDARVRTNTKSGFPEIAGRLMTINGFAFTGDGFAGFPEVEANFSVTTYLVPAEQGLAAGATPAGPAPAGSPGDPSTVAAPSAAVTP